MWFHLHPNHAHTEHFQMGAVEAGHEVKISLSGDSVVLLNPTVAENVQGMGLPALKEVIGFLKEHSVPVFG